MTSVLVLSPLSSQILSDEYYLLLKPFIDASDLHVVNYADDSVDMYDQICQHHNYNLVFLSRFGEFGAVSNSDNPYILETGVPNLFSELEQTLVSSPNPPQSITFVSINAVDQNKDIRQAKIAWQDEDYYEDVVTYKPLQDLFTIHSKFTTIELANKRSPRFQRDLFEMWIKVLALCQPSANLKSFHIYDFTIDINSSKLDAFLSSNLNFLYSVRQIYRKLLALEEETVDIDRSTEVDFCQRIPFKRDKLDIDAFKLNKPFVHLATDIEVDETSTFLSRYSEAVAGFRQVFKTGKRVIFDGLKLASLTMASIPRKASKQYDQFQIEEVRQATEDLRESILSKFSNSFEFDAVFAKLNVQHKLITQRLETRITKQQTLGAVLIVITSYLLVCGAEIYRTIMRNDFVNLLIVSILYFAILSIPFLIFLIWRAYSLRKLYDNFVLEVRNLYNSYEDYIVDIEKYADEIVSYFSGLDLIERYANRKLKSDQNRDLLSHHIRSLDNIIAKYSELVYQYDMQLELGEIALPPYVYDFKQRFPHNRIYRLRDEYNSAAFSFVSSTSYDWVRSLKND